MDDRKSWSELSPEILSAIGKRLDSRTDFFHFRSVCKNWRLSLNPNPNPNILSSLLPLKISNPTLPFCSRPDDPLILIARTVLLVKPLDQQSQWILTVEEFNPGKLRILYPLSRDRVTNLSPNFPKYVSLLEFNVSELSKGYGFRYSSDESDVSGVTKVVLCSDSCTAMVLYGKGILVGVRLKNGNWGYVHKSLVSAFKDVINFKEMIYAIDYEGNVYVVDHKTMKVVRTIAGKPKLSAPRQRYLVASKGELCLVRLLADQMYSMAGFDSTVNFEVRSLDEKKGQWMEITNQMFAMFFVSCDSCFCLDVNNSCHYFVFPEHCLASSANRPPAEYKLFETAGVDLQLWSFCIDSHKFLGGHRIRCIRSMLWPPPAWFWSDTYSSSGDEEEEVSDLCNQKICGKVLPRSLAVENHMPTMDLPSGASSIQVNEEAPLLSSFHGASEMTFDGLNIKPNLVPTLQKLCAKHGNLMEGCPLQNKGIISRALESLAEAVLILMGNTGQSLGEPQADFLRTAVSDLQQMNFKVAWLIPFVERALAVQKTRALVGSLKEFAKIKAQAEETKLKVLDEPAKLDEKEEDLTLVLEKIPALEEVDLNKCLGEGLY